MEGMFAPISSPIFELMYLNGTSFKYSIFEESLRAGESVSSNGQFELLYTVDISVSLLPVSYTHLTLPTNREV